MADHAGPASVARPVQALPPRQLAVPWIAVAALAAVAWAVTVLLAQNMGNGPGTTGLALLPFLGLWVVMMSAMMPSVAPPGGMAILLLQGAQEFPADLFAAPAGLLQTRQCAWCWACRSHSSPQLWQMATQACSSGLATSASYAAGRLMTPAVAVQTSAQFRHSRMHLTISARLCSLKSASVSAAQAWAQSLTASMAAASRSASTLMVPE